MRTLLGSLILVLISTCLTGCLSGGDPSPSPSSSRPVLKTPSVSATPTSQWTDEEQQAINAVLKYYEVWAHIGQNVDEIDLDLIYEVAMDPNAEQNIQAWQQWVDKGWHLVGSPTFIPQMVTVGMKNSTGHQHDVHGCLTIEGSYLVDASGSTAPVKNRTERSAMIVTVFHSEDDSLVVVSDRTEKKPC